MDFIQTEHEKLLQHVQDPKALHEANNIIDLLENAKRDIQRDPSSTSITLARLQTPVKNSFDSSLGTLKETYSGMNKYAKALDKFFKDKPLPGPEYDAISHQSDLTRGAITMHLLREGEFQVSDIFLAEFSEMVGKEVSLQPGPQEAIGHFRKMYDILGELRYNGNPQPVMEWVAENRGQLEERGSNLEFELFRWQFIWIFNGAGDPNMPAAEARHRAIEYARERSSGFRERHFLEFRQLICAMAFHSNLDKSPYHRVFDSQDAWHEAIASFSREFCFLLGLTASSPLLHAVNAGCVALPALMKMNSLMNQTRANWTTQQELPAEVPLPSSLQFHSIFVCPVSKEQATQDNPAMLLPCGHVLAKQSLENIARVSFIKCPYCPQQAHVSEAQSIIL